MPYSTRRDANVDYRYAGVKIPCEICMIDSNLDELNHTKPDSDSDRSEHSPENNDCISRCYTAALVFTEISLRLTLQDRSIHV